MKTKKKKTLVPELRFPEFLGDKEWNYDILSTLACPVKEKAAKVKPDDVLTLSGEHGLVRQTDYFGKKIAGENLSRYLKIKQDDFVYNDRTTSANKYGSLKRLTNYSNGAVSPIYKCFRFNKNENPLYWEYYFEAGVHEDEISEFVNEGARAGRFNISVDMFLSISVSYPSILEQEKIAACLSSLDELITAHSSKLTALQDHKTALLQQLFPTQGKTTPSLRFPEFKNAGDWDEHNLSDLFHFQDGYAFKSIHLSEFAENSTQVIRITDINNHNTNENKVFISNTRINTDDFSKYYVSDGDLLLSLTGAAGFNFFFWDNQRALINQRTAKVIPKDNTNKTLTRLLEPLIHEKINARGEGQNNNLSKEFLNSITIFIPKQEEQDKIATLLSNLDHLITAHTQQINSLKTHKKGLMQKLFPA